MTNSEGGGSYTTSQTSEGGGCTENKRQTLNKGRWHRHIDHVLVLEAVGGALAPGQALLRGSSEILNVSSGNSWKLLWTSAQR